MKNLGDGLAPTCLAKPSDPNCFHSLFNFPYLLVFFQGGYIKKMHFFTVTVIEIFDKII